MVMDEIDTCINSRSDDFSLLPRKIWWLHISKPRRAISLKFCIRNAFIGILTDAKFLFNRLMLTLTFGIRASAPPPPPSPTGPCERLKRLGLIGLRLEIHLIRSISNNYQPLFAWVIIFIYSPPQRLVSQIQILIILKGELVRDSYSKGNK